jgi:hypothetical protein
MDDLEREIFMIDVKLKELQQRLEVKEEFRHSTPMQQSTAKQSSLHDTGMETGRPPMFPRQNTSPVLSSDPLYHESMLGKNRDRGDKSSEPLSQR